jgi:predicted DsbA family dithiol-disulfide isomerase
VADDAPVPVYVYWDYSCPFCYLGSHRLERLAGERELRVAWRPLEIHTGIPAEGLPVKEAGFAPDRWAAIVGSVEGMADREGMELEIPSFITRTGEALQAALFAQDLGDKAFRRLHRAIFRAYFVHGANLGDRDRLLEIAGEADVDPEALSEALDDERYADELRRAREEAARYEVSGTPTFLFGRHKVVGAAPMDVLRDAADRAAADPAAGDG